MQGLPRLNVSWQAVDVLSMHHLLNRCIFAGQHRALVNDLLAATMLSSATEWRQKFRFNASGRSCRGTPFELTVLSFNVFLIAISCWHQDPDCCWHQDPDSLFVKQRGFYNCGFKF